MADLIGSVTSEILTKSINRTVMENKLIGNDIANIDTVGYVGKTTSKGVLYRELAELIENQNTDELEWLATNWEPRSEISSLEVVTLERQMTRLAENTLLFESLITAKSKLSEILKAAVREGR
ncbi:hypothetical protein [Microbulbifer sp. SSSA005]|uniref:hypothetical protein n=1 Tax=Microbulbifer sp. SSSA005 TaxID=3243378 RepID=UPI004039F04D